MVEQSFYYFYACAEHLKICRISPAKIIVREAGHPAFFVELAFAFTRRLKKAVFVDERNCHVADGYFVCSRLFWYTHLEWLGMFPEPFFLDCGCFSKALSREDADVDGRAVYVISCCVPYFAQFVIGEDTGAGNVA